MLFYQVISIFLAYQKSFPLTQELGMIIIAIKTVHSDKCESEERLLWLKNIESD